MRKIELDVAYDESLEETMTLWGEMFPKVFMRIARRAGDSGGWPILEFVADDADLRKFLVTYGVEPDDVETYMYDSEEI